MNIIEEEIAGVAEFQPLYVQNLFDTLFIPTPEPDGTVLYVAPKFTVTADYNPDGADVELDNGLLNKIITGSADDYIQSLSGQNVVLAGAGFDFIQTGAGDDKIQGGAGDDEIDSGTGSDTISGGDGDDSIYAWGNAVISGGAGDDTLATDAGTDRVSGGDGNDDISTWTGDDVIFGGAGDDTIDAGDGYDEITGGAGDDEIWGGEGKDTFVFDGNDGNDTIFDFEVGDQIQVGAGATFIDNGGDDWTMIWGSTIVDVQTLGVTAITFDHGMWIGN